ncbi:MAG: hypothetical protein IPJ60_19445 [Sphingobacteriaceae bacterium]|nr:hypothetical protein [Sphingobacteriaceae bacterium]
MLEKLGTFARNSPITAGREGNINAMISQIKSVGKTIGEFKQLEKTVQQELDEHKEKCAVINVKHMINNMEELQ